MKRLREHKHPLNIIYVPAAIVGIIGVEVFACPFSVAALLVLLVVAAVTAVAG